MQWEKGTVIKGRIGKQTKLQLFNLGLKRCGYCHRLLGLEKFGQDQSTPLGLTHYCKACKQSRDQEYYDEVKDRVAKDRQVQKIKLVQLMGGSCRRCGYREFLSALVCHHVKPNQKDYTISELIGGRRLDISEEVVLAELDKCILLCSNCHKGLHTGEWQEEFVKCDGIGYSLASSAQPAAHPAGMTNDA